MKVKTYYYLFLFLLVCSFVSACGARGEKTPEPVQFDSQVEIILQPDPEKTDYEIGEYISYALLIKNYNEVPIEIRGVAFCMYQLTFAPPNGMHLIGPDGRDLLLPYQQPTVADDDCPSIQVEAQGEFWDRITPSLWLHLRQPGQYTFWIELMDSLGKLHRSNEISFQLVDVPASVSPELFELTLRPEKTSYTVKDLLDVAVKFEAILTNNSSEPLVFLEPSGNSFSNCLNPVCELTVIDSAGRTLTFGAGDCGIFGAYDYSIKAVTYNEFILEPGSSRQLDEFPLSIYPEMQRPGEYRVRLTYIVREKAIKLGVVLDEPMNWEEGMFTGVVESNEIILEIVE